MSSTQLRTVLGQFGAAPGRPGTMTLVPDPAPEKVIVQGARFKHAVTPGVLDADAKNAFMNGQCVAFAAALAPRLGTTRISLAVRSDDGTIIHAYIEVDGQIIDANGSRPLDEYEQELDAAYTVVCGDCDGCADGDGCDDADVGYEYDSLDLDEVAEIADTEYGNGLPRQNWELAETMMDVFTADLGPRMNAA